MSYEVQVLNQSHPTARKEHRCMYCGGVIHKGEKYQRSTNLYDGTVYDWITHDKCEEVARLLDMYDRNWDDGLNADDFNEYVWEAVNELDPDGEQTAECKTIEQRVDWLLAHKELLKD